jgi:CDP-paratose 2-epimerase
VQALWSYAQSPTPGAVYNLGGGKANAASILECIELIADASGGRRPRLTFVDEPRIGDHICYYTDMARFRADHPTWRLEHDLPSIVEEMVGMVRSQLD